MKTFLLFLLCSACCLPVGAQIQPAWVARYNNGIASGQHQALKMALDPSGNPIICGFSQNTNGGTGYATLKFAPYGTQLWAARYDLPGPSNAAPTGFALDGAGQPALTGNAGTVKYGSTGAQLWFAPAAGLALAADIYSNTFVTGLGTIFNTTKFSPQGTNIWTATFQDAGPTIGQVVGVDSNDNVYVAGPDVDYYYTDGPYTFPAYMFLIMKFTSNAVAAWGTALGDGTSAPVAANAFQLDSHGNVYVDFSSEATSFETVKIGGSNGATLWATYDPAGNFNSDVHELSLDNLENVYITGQNDYFSWPNCTYATYKINTNGSYLWTNCFPYLPTSQNPATSVNVATSIALDRADNSYVTGYSPDANGTNDIVTIAYDTNGKQLWLQRYTGLGYGAVGNAIACDNSGNVYVAGYENVPGGGAEMVLIKYSPVALQRQSNGNFLLQAQGSPGEPFDIQASTNLQSWNDLGVQDADTNGLLQYLDTNAPLFPWRFYLAVPQ